MTVTKRTKKPPAVKEVSATDRLNRILEDLRQSNFSDLDKNFVAQVADVENRNVFDDSRVEARKELRQLIAIQLQSERLEKDEE
jgi:hypothetical protein